MKVSNRFIRNGIVCFCLLFFTSISVQLFAQGIPDTDGTSNCSDCIPAGWVDGGGTPDISNNTTAAATTTGGGGATWIVAPGDSTPLVLPAPPNGHANWLSLRDLGGGGVEESVSTTITGLTIGRSYEVIAYSLTVVSDNNGRGGAPYAQTYNDQFSYQVGALPIQNVSPISINNWSTSRFPFVATSTSEVLFIRPGNNSAATGATASDFILFETVQVSITLNAINAVPVADDNIASTTGTTPVTFNVVNTDIDYDGNIAANTVDLDPTSDGLQNTLMTSDGIWTVNASGDVTFTPDSNFSGGSTSITYTVMDDYTLDGANQAATSNVANLTVNVDAVPSIEAIKTVRIVDNGNGILGINDRLNYTISITNTGNLPLTDVSIIDTFRDNFGVVRNFNSGPVFVSADQGSAAGSLQVGETATYSASFVIDRPAVDAGGVNNTVQAFANSTAGGVSDVSDDGDPTDTDGDGNPNNDPTVTNILENPRLEVVKTFTISDDGNGVISVDDIIIYSITVRNRGNVTLTNLRLEDQLEDFLGNPRTLRSGPSYINSNQGSSEGTLRVGEIATYNATYVITQEDVDAGGVRNSATAIANSPVGTEVRDVSDDNDDTDGDVLDDPTETPIPQTPSIEVTKIAALTDNGDNIDGVDDTITYTITIENTGNVFVDNISWVDTFQNFDGTDLNYTTGITFVESDQGSPEGELQVGETASYTATYTLTQEDVNSGGVSNSVEGSATSLTDEEARDISDDGDDTDGNITNDPTITEIDRISRIEATKTLVVNDNGDGENGVDDIISYNITLENTGNVDLTITNILDTLTDANGLPLTLTTGPTFLSASDGSDATTLKVGEIATYTATYLITQAAVDGGGVINSFRVEAQGPDGSTVIDISDDGDDTDGNTEDDTTDLIIDSDPSIEVTKIADLNDNGDGVVGIDDFVRYTITVENTGNVTIDNITLTDILTDLGGNVLTLTSGPTFAGSDMGSSAGSLDSGETATYTATYVLTQSDVNAGGISNTVTANGLDPANNDISDVSDDGDDTDGNVVDDPTETLVAQDPSIEATKIATISDNGDNVLGVGDIVSYSILITNNGNVNLSNVSFTDTLEDFRGNGRNLDTGPTFVSADMNSAEGFLLVGETATYTATYAIEQRDVNVGGIRNQVFAQGDSPLDVTVTDQSDDGDDLDGNTEDDPTETVTPEFPSMEAIKIANVDLGDDGELSAQDVITYTITIENTGNVNLNNVSLNDQLTDVQGNSLTLTSGPTFIAADQDSPESILLVGETATYIATYVLTQNDIDVGGVSNTVLATGNSPFGIDVEDRSDDGNPADTDGDGDPDNDPTETLVEEDPSIEATKIADVVDNGDGILGAGDTINYTITFENTGNVTLNITDITDTLTNFDGTELSLDSGPTFNGADQGSAEGTILPGEIATYNASYTITQDDVNSTGISNTVDVSAETNLDTPTSDTSDDGDDADGNTTDDPTETLFPSIEITKTFTINDNGDLILGPGDEIEYTITVENNGLVPVTGITLTDNLTDFDGNPLTLDSGPNFASSDQGSLEGILLPGETATYTATYTITVDDVATGGIRNSVDGTATGPNGGGVNDTSDDGDDTDGNTEDDPTETAIPEILELETTKTANVIDNGDGVLGAGDSIEYTITVENKGNTLMTGVSIIDTISDFNGNVLTLTSGPTFTGTNLTGIEGILIPGEIATYTATYTITQSDVDAGGISNTVDASGNSPLGDSTTDTSDDGDDTDGNIEDDPTETIIPEIIGLEVTKTATVFDDSDGVGVGDVITYNITVQNTGNVSVNGITITDTLSDFTGTTLTLDSGPDYISSDSGSGEGSLLPNETATYSATYTITQNDVDAGGVSNTATAEGTTAGGTPVSDVSDDGDDTDGNIDNDPTETPIVEVVSLEVTKTASVNDDSDGIQPGDIITYTITVENTGNVTVNDITIEDNLTDFLGNIITLDSGPDFENASAASPEGTLMVGETANYTATYTITQSDVDAGGVSNSAEASGNGAGGTPVNDVSDDGDDTDGNVDDDPTETPIPENISIEATKTFTVTDDDGILGAGDTINYTITVENTGNVTVNITDIIDTLTDFNGETLTLTSGPDFQIADMGSAEGTLVSGETATYLATYVITQDDVDAGGVRNSVDVIGNGNSGTDVDDTSDDGDDTDGNVDDDPTETPISANPRLEVTKTFSITNNGNEVLGAGDDINYVIAIENTGNVTLTIDQITDTIQDFLRNGLTLTSGPTFNNSSLGSAEGTILPGETAFYDATYTITQSDVEAGGVSNSVFVETDSDNGTPADDVSDDGDDTDGNTEDDPTETPILEVESLEVIKIAEAELNADGIVGIGSLITYTITIENNGNVDLQGLSFVDTFTDLLGNALTFDSEPTFVSSSLGSAENTLLVDEVATYTATYTITQSDVEAGGVSNTLTATASDDEGDTAEDQSDDGNPADTDGDGDPDNDPTVTETEDDYDLSITKEVDNQEPFIGENVVFTITITNDGLVTANAVTVTDILPSGYDFVTATTTAGVYSEVNGNWTIDSLAPGAIEILEITVEVLGVGDYLNTATITDTQRGDDDDPSNDSDSADVEPVCLTVYNEFSPNGDGVNETFEIDCIERYPNAKLEVYNRWGNLVFETVGYQNDWSGTSNGRAVVSQDQDLPVGTYYYVLDIGSEREPLTGWLYINR